MLPQILTCLISVALKIAVIQQGIYYCPFHTPGTLRFKHTGTFKILLMCPPQPCQYSMLSVLQKAVIKPMPTTEGREVTLLNLVNYRRSN